MGTISWVGSGGGPLIVVPSEIAHHWRGVETTRPPTGDLDSIWEDVRSKDDYGRACGVDDYLGVLACGPGECLILGDEPMQTTILPTGDGGLVVRWMWAESDEDVRRAARSAPEGVWGATSHRFDVGGGGLLLFDSAYPGDDLPTTSEGAGVPWLRVTVPSGTYEIDTADHQPDEQTRLILHRLRRARHGIGPHRP